MIDTSGLELYVVTNQSGQFFRAKGYGGIGESWVDDIKKAKVYTRLGQARSRVTWFAKNYSSYGIPKIIKLTVTNTDEINEENRVKKSIDNKIKQDLIREKKNKEYRIAMLQGQKDKINDQLSKLEK